MEVQINMVTSSSQVDVVASLAKTIWTDHYSPIIGKEQVDYMLAKYQTPKSILAQMDQEGNYYFLIYSDFVPEGYIGIIEKLTQLLLSKL